MTAKDPIASMQEAGKQMVGAGQALIGGAKKLKKLSKAPAAKKTKRSSKGKKAKK